MFFERFRHAPIIFVKKIFSKNIFKMLRRLSHKLDRSPVSILAIRFFFLIAIPRNDAHRAVDIHPLVSAGPVSLQLRLCLLNVDIRARISRRIPLDGCLHGSKWRTFWLRRPPPTIHGTGMDNITDQPKQDLASQHSLPPKSRSAHHGLTIQVCDGVN